MTIWLLPIALLVFTTLCAIPLSRYLAWIMDGKYRAPKVLRWFEARLDSGPQDWKQYTAALLIFNVVMFVFGYLVLALQPVMPWNPRGLGLLSPTTIFNAAASFITNTNLQHYSGDQHFSNFSQVFFVIFNQFTSAAVGFCALTAIIRAFRGEKTVGNYFLDMWRVVVYAFLPVAFIIGVIFMQQGMPMTHQSAYQVSTLEPGGDGHGRQGPGETADHGGRSGRGGHPDQDARHQRRRILRHELRPPVRESHGPDQLRDDVCHDVVPVLAGADVRPNARPAAARRRDLRGDDAHDDRHDRMDDPLRHAETEPRLDRASRRPNLRDPQRHRAGRKTGCDARRRSRVCRWISIWAISKARKCASAPRRARRSPRVTVDVTCGAVNAEHDSLNPIAALSPMTGMWLNCIFGGKGVGMINMLIS